MNCAVVSNTPLAEGFFHLNLEPEKPLGAVTPGQFVMVRCADSTDPLLRRPMGVADCDADGSRFGLVVQEIGAGTRILSALVHGDTVDVIGPFGKGFKAPGEREHVWIVAGGTGIAPFVGMMASADYKVASYTVFLGARSRELLLYEDVFHDTGAEVVPATEDGSQGYHGLVTEPFKARLENDGPPDMVFTCGPSPMMAAVAQIAKSENVPCFASLENRMACGFGACLGCVTKSMVEDRYVTVCRKGPVFDVTEVEIG